MILAATLTITVATKSCTLYLQNNFGYKKVVHVCYKLIVATKESYIAVILLHS